MKKNKDDILVWLRKNQEKFLEIKEWLQKKTIHKVSNETTFLFLVNYIHKKIEEKSLEGKINEEKDFFY